MQCISRAIVLFTALIATPNLGAAQGGRFTAQQPDFSTCSSARNACAVGTARRGHSQAGCERAYRTCMRTGLWDTYGTYGRRVAGVERR